MLRLNLTTTILDKLGFRDYNDSSGDWGTRTLPFEDGTWFRIAEVDEKDDDSDGYSFHGSYVSNHYYYAGYIANPKNDAPHCDLFFLHEMYEVIEKYYPAVLDEFVTKCRTLKMGSYIDDYLKVRDSEKH